MSVASEVRSAVRQRDGRRCTECGMSNEAHVEKYGRSLEVHRLIPGGPYSLGNCVTLCIVCHGPKPRSPRGLPVPRELAVKIKAVVRSSGESASAYVARLLSPLIEADWAKLPRGRPEPPSLTYFGRRLRELRIARRLSQWELADRTGIDQSAISTLEHGLRSPTWVTVLALSIYFGVSCEVFRPPADAPPRRGRPKKE